MNIKSTDEAHNQILSKFDLIFFSKQNICEGTFFYGTTKCAYKLEKVQSIYNPFRLTLNVNNDMITYYSFKIKEKLHEFLKGTFT